MKKIIIILLFPAFAFANKPPKQVKIMGHAQFSQPLYTMYLSYRLGDENITDSAELKNGTFQFTENIAEPVLAVLRVKFAPKEGQTRGRYEALQLFLEPGEMKINIKDSLKSAKVMGSKSNTEFTKLNELQKPFTDKGRELSKQYSEFRKAKDEEGMKRVEKEMDAIDEKMKEDVYHSYLVKNKKSPIALYVLNQYAGYDLDAKKIEPIYEGLSSIAKHSPSGVEFKEKIATAKKTGVGVYAMEFTQNDTLGNPVSLSSFKGKYVLLDFWASWCGPCRAENPNVVEAFNEYNDKNFTVLSISLDQPGKKQAWLDAIHKDGLAWNHVSDLKFWDNAVAKQYGIRAIPQNLLLDPSGKIIGKNIRGEELNKKLAEVIK